MEKSTPVNPNPCFQHSTQIRLCIHFWEWRGDFLTEPYFNISHNGETFILKVWGEFWGNWPKEKYKGIDFNADATKPTLEKALDGVCDAWSAFGVKGKSGCHCGDHVGGGDIWWNVSIPFSSNEELVGSEFSKKLRDSLVKLAESFAILLPYRVSTNSK